MEQVAEASGDEQRRRFDDREAIITNGLLVWLSENARTCRVSRHYSSRMQVARHDNASLLHQRASAHSANIRNVSSPFLLFLSLFPIFFFFNFFPSSLLSPFVFAFRTRYALASATRVPSPIAFEKKERSLYVCNVSPVSQLRENVNPTTKQSHSSS